MTRTTYSSLVQSVADVDEQQGACQKNSERDLLDPEHAAASAHER
jgi:hypothetical protein